MTHRPSRRTLLRGVPGLFGGAAMPAFLQALVASNALAKNATALAASPYGPLAPKPDLATGLPLLMLPEGFTYRTFGWAGDPMSNGKPSPGNHDGMGIVAVRGRGAAQEVTLVRNHERHMSTRPIEAAAVYDRVALSNGSETASPGGGTVTLVYRDGALASSTPSLGGTLVNCAGGVTPWGSWLTCEETIDDLGARGGRKHGYVFEVSADPRRVTGEPIVGMGRFRHEAALVDPQSGHVYLTEDDPLKSGFYRYVPRDTARNGQALARGGRLQAARAVGRPNADLLLPTQGEVLQIEWIDIAEPDAAPGEMDLRGTRVRASGPFRQAWAAGALRMARGEGLALHAGKLYVIDTSAGPSTSGRVGTGSGVIWELDLASQRMRAVFVSERPIAAHMIDNITTGPRGGLLACEDGGGVPDEHGPGTRLIGVLSNGESYAFAKNNVVLGPDQTRAAAKQVGPGDFRGAEFAGACFTPDGDTLFVNVYTPGFTAAIRGPWSRGPL